MSTSIFSSLARALAAAVLLGAVLMMTACVSGVSVGIENKSDTPLTNVVVSGKGFRQSVGKIAAGGTETLHVRPRGESGVKVSFEADGRTYSSESGYVEDEFLYRVVVTVATDFTITIDTNTR